MFRFIAEPSSASEVVDWFLALNGPPRVIPVDGGVFLHFADLGPIGWEPTETLDTARSPVVAVLLPQVRRRILWTVGEVRFLTTPLRETFPALQKLASAFSAWLGSHRQVFPASSDESFDDYLEGSVRNYDPPIHALPSGLRALVAGHYFLSAHDNEQVLETLCRTLRLRGVVCG